MPSTADLLLLDYDVEIANTRRTLERVPLELADWRPHPRSMPMGRLAMHCASMPLFGAYVFTDAGMDMASPLHPHASLDFHSQEQCLQRLASAAAECRSALAASSDAALAEPWPFSYGEQIISRLSRALSFRMLCFNHLVHHTAQLGVYLRLNDLPVPALYGPSADEQWTAAL